MRQVIYEHLTPLQRAALHEASKALEKSYSPYSRFCVGACLFSSDGKMVSGANFENSAYGSTICAERSAVVRANAMGLRHFKGIAVIARGKKFRTTEITGPCGSCRQVLYELSEISGRDLEVILSTSDMEKIVITTIRELLPLAFGPIDLKINMAKYQR